MAEQPIQPYTLEQMAGFPEGFTYLDGDDHVEAGTVLVRYEDVAHLIEAQTVSELSAKALDDWEAWSNSLAALIPERFDDDSAQEAIIERVLRAGIAALEREAAPTDEAAIGDVASTSPSENSASESSIRADERKRIHERVDLLLATDEAEGNVTADQTVLDTILAAAPPVSGSDDAEKQRVRQAIATLRADVQAVCAHEPGAGGKVCRICGACVGECCFHTEISFDPPGSYCCECKRPEPVSGSPEPQIVSEPCDCDENEGACRGECKGRPQPTDEPPCVICSEPGLECGQEDTIYRKFWCERCRSLWAIDDKGEVRWQRGNRARPNDLRPPAAVSGSTEPPADRQKPCNRCGFRAGHSIWCRNYPVDEPAETPIGGQR